MLDKSNFSHSLSPNVFFCNRNWKVFHIIKLRAYYELPVRPNFALQNVFWGCPSVHRFMDLELWRSGVGSAFLILSLLYYKSI